MEKKENLKMLNRIVLGLVMLIPGLSKLFITGSAGVSQMLSGIILFSWAPIFWAWILIISEVIFGVAILVNYKLKYTVIPPMIILVVAAFTFSLGSWGSFLLHLATVTNFAILAEYKF